MTTDAAVQLSHLCGFRICRVQRISPSLSLPRRHLLPPASHPHTLTARSLLLHAKFENTRLSLRRQLWRGPHRVVKRVISTSPPSLSPASCICKTSSPPPSGQGTNVDPQYERLFSPPKEYLEVSWCHPKSVWGFGV
jgi:hypothetical protein